MKTSQNHIVTRLALLAGFFTWMLAGTAFSEDATAENARALLDKVKQREVDRQIAVKQTDIDRLKEDLDKGKTEADGLQKTIDVTGKFINESSGNLDQLVSQRKRLEQVLNLTELRIDAERRKTEGLRMLGDAQNKSLAAVTRRNEETDARSNVRAAEMKLLSEGIQVPDDDRAGKDLLKLRKALATCELKTASQERIAREAMKAATSKLQLADAAAARAKRTADEVGAPDPVGEKPPEEKDAPAPNNTAPKQ